MALRLERIGRVGSIALLAFVACGESDTTPGGGTSGSSSGSGGTPGASGSSSGNTSAGAGGSVGGSAAGAMSAGTGGMPGGTGGGGAGGVSGGSGGSAGAGGAKSKTTFFVTSDTSKTGNLGGLDGADARCQTLAEAAGFGDHTFKAYLSTSTVSAKDRIGTGPWFNSMGTMLAADVTALHSMTGKADLFIDEKGAKINGQWAGSPTPNQHDILTGSKADGTTSGKTCMDWTSASGDDAKTVGHSDGLGPNMDMSAPRNSWVAAHETEGCDDTAPGGGAGRIYCFAID